MVNERRRQILLGYRDSLAIAYFISVFTFPTTLQFGLERAIYMFLLGGFLFGTCFFVLVFARQRIRIPSFALNVLAQTLATSVTIVVAGSMAIIGGIAIFAQTSPLEPRVIERGRTFLEPAPLILLLGGGTLFAGLVNGLFALDRKLGPGVLWNWLSGKYYNPREEERIFMFLDLNDSTSIAESLGNLKFSALIRDFFRDLTYPLLETGGEVSHYVGDEAVLTWKLARGLKDANCVQLFFKMRHAIEERAGFYKSEYGFVPQFKAGVHVGRVVATEVGEVKTEIVFHGDVLNTAARIQGICNTEGCPLLVSAECANLIALPANLSLRSLGTRQLKGKAHELEIFAVDIVSPNFTVSR